MKDPDCENAGSENLEFLVTKISRFWIGEIVGAKLFLRKHSES